MNEQYEPVIGLEVHAQLKTKSKMFCRCDNNAEGKEPNTVCCPVCMGFPGVLPVPNKEAIEWTMMLGLALGAKIAPKFNFERKNYFYPDLPKGYQITSQTIPPIIGGELEIETSKGKKVVHFEHVHLEEDAGKLVHPDGADFSLVDLNRASTPLLEMVSLPDIHSAEEAKIFMQELQRILRYLDISFADMEKGHLRCDANISVRPKGQKELGKKVEIKNMNSFASLERALNYEIERQIDALEAGEALVQETRGWDDAKGKTFSQRTKEMEHDYRYFPEPDIPEIVPSELFDLKALENKIPELPAEKRARYKGLGLSDVLSQTIITDPIYYLPFEAEFGKLKNDKQYQIYGDLITSYGWGVIKNGGELDAQDWKNFAEAAVAIDERKISNNIAKQLFPEMIKTKKSILILTLEKGIKEMEKFILSISSHIVQTTHPCQFLFPNPPLTQ